MLYLRPVAIPRTPCPHPCVIGRHAASPVLDRSGTAIASARPQPDYGTRRTRSMKRRALMLAAATKATLALTLAAGAVIGTIGTASAQQWPTKPVRIIA